MSGSRNLLGLGQPEVDLDNPLLGGTPTLADAWRTNAQMAQDWIDQQRAVSAQRGLWDGQGMTVAGARDAGGQLANALMMGTTAPRFRAFHGSPHDFERFDAGKIGSGEGAQAYGHGLYVAENEGVAREYRDALSATAKPGDNGWFVNGVRDAALPKEQQDVLRQYLATRDGKVLQGTPLENAVIDAAPAGHMYEVGINADPAHFLDWDKPLSEQSQHVQSKIANLSTRGIGPRNPDPAMTGGELYQDLMHKGGKSSDVAGLLAQPVPGTDAGLAGIRYLDAGSRGGSAGTSNHVVFDANMIEILRKYGLGGLMAGAGAAAATARGD